MDKSGHGQPKANLPGSGHGYNRSAWGVPLRQIRRNVVASPVNVEGRP
jgi:hypothetical protein